MSDTPGQTEGGPQVELTLYADVTTVQLVHEADLWMVAYTHGGSPGAIDHIDTGTLAGEVGSGANDGDVVRRRYDGATRARSGPLDGGVHTRWIAGGH